MKYILRIDDEFEVFDNIIDATNAQYEAKLDRLDDNTIRASPVKVAMVYKLYDVDTLEFLTIKSKNKKIVYLEEYDLMERDK